jgi:hypothetical protein
MPSESTSLRDRGPVQRQQIAKRCDAGHGGHSRFIGLFGTAPFSRRYRKLVIVPPGRIVNAVSKFGPGVLRDR